MTDAADEALESEDTDADLTADAAADQFDAEPDADRPDFFICGVGASAGGLDALEKLFDAMPDDPGMAFVIVQHLSPDFESLMDEILGRHTRMPVRRVTNAMMVEPNCVYLNPPGSDMIISSGQLLIKDKERDAPFSLPIDRFLRSLAQDAEERSIGVILSGTGSDGSRGIRDVHDSGGLVIVQSETSADFDGMPRSAIDTGVPDLVVEPARIPAALESYRTNPWREHFSELMGQVVGDTPIQTLFQLLQNEYSIDFTHYKPTTISRRIQRRLQMQHCDDIETYVERVRESSDELRDLYNDLLIGVTRFFRDTEAFDHLEDEFRNHVLPQVKNGEEIRIWCAACSTGEEPYSLAIMVHQMLEQQGRSIGLRIFATDVDKRSLEAAANGQFPPESLTDVSDDLRNRYFTQSADGWQVVPEIRRLVVFAPHNVLRDAPFTNLHLVSCRNLLIYLQSESQKRVISLFHFGMATGGLLFLGSSETPGALSDEFESIHDRHHIFRKLRDIRLPGTFRSPLQVPVLKPRHFPPAARIHEVAERTETPVSVVYEQILEQTLPPSLLVNREGDVMHSFSGGAKYLHHRDGRYSMKLMELVDGDLKLALSSLFSRGFDSARTEPLVFPHVRIGTPEGDEQVRVTVQPLKLPDDVQSLLVSFECPDSERPAGVEVREIDISEPAAARIGQLETELTLTKESLHSTIQQLETGNEELQATNEELIAANEELQSTNEELNSVNEELYTVNAEYQNKIRELEAMTNDMDNLLRSTEVHTVFLDRSLSIRKFTPRISEVFGLLPVDVGRRIDTFRHTIQHPTLIEDLQSVLESGAAVEAEVTVRDDHPYLLRLLPYHVEGRADPEGVLLTLIDIQQLKEQSAEVQQLRETSAALEEVQSRLNLILNSAGEGIYGLDLEGRTTFVNPAAAGMIGWEPEELIGKGQHDILHHSHADGTAYDRDDCPIYAAYRDGEPHHVEDEVFWRKDGSSFPVEYLSTPIRDDDGELAGAVVVFRDITERRAAEQALQETESRFDRCVRGGSDGIWDWELDSDVVFWSPRFWELLGESPENGLGSITEFNNRLHPDDHDRTWSSVNEHLDGAKPTFDLDYRLRVKDGSYRWFRVRAIAGRDVDGKPVRLSGSISDIHYRKELEFSLRDQVAQRDRFLAMLSHELRNPLAGILNASFLLQQEGKADDEATGLIDRQTRHMSRLLEDLLDASRITQGRFQLQKQTIDLNILVDDIRSGVSEAFDEKNITLKVESPDSSLVVYGDPTRLQQAQANLLTNACKFTPDGGEVVWLLERSGDDVLIHVKDNGCGLTNEEVKHVFEMFYQAESPGKASRKGLGIGLSLVQFIVNEHGGSITALSAGRDQGATFEIRLPLQDAPSGERVEDSSIFRIARPESILLVEDAEGSRAMLARSLRMLGHQVVDVGTGEDAIRQCKAAPPGAILLDIGLPGISGHEVARAVREELGLNDVLIIALTGFGRPEDRELAMQSGCDEHLVKPISPPDVLDTISRLRSQ